jgi:hypothetical protein
LFFLLHQVLQFVIAQNLTTKKNALSIACSAKNMPMVRFLLEQGVSLESIDFCNMQVIIKLKSTAT